MSVTVCVVCGQYLSGDPDSTNFEQGICGPECLETWDREQFGGQEMEHVCMHCGCKLKDDTPGPGTSHGLCIPCLREHYPEVAAEVEADLDKQAGITDNGDAKTTAR